MSIIALKKGDPMYLLKFTSVPKEVKKRKIVPLKKWIYLPQAQQAYFKLTETGGFAGELECCVRNQDTQQEVEFELVYEDGYSLSDLINQDLINEIRRTNDEKLRTTLEIMENEISLSFLEPISEKNEEIQEEKPRLLSLIEFKLPFKKKHDTGNDRDIEEHYEEETSVEAKHESDDSYVPEYEDGLDQENELLLQSLDEPEEKNSSVPTVPPANDHSSTESVPVVSYPSLREYIMIESADSFAELDNMLHEVQLVIDQGSKYVFSQLNLLEPRTFIETKQQEYIKSIYSKQYFEELCSSLLEIKSDILNQGILSLTEYYEKVSQPIPDERLREHAASLKADIESQYQDKLSRILAEEAHKNKLYVQQVTARHAEELKLLKKKQADELTAINNEYATKKQVHEDTIRTMAEEESQQEIEKCLSELQATKKKNDAHLLESFKIEKLTGIRQAVTESITETQRKQSEYLKICKDRLNQERPAIERAYNKYLEEKEIEENKKKQREELNLRARELAIEEKKVNLEEKSLQESIHATQRIEKQNQEMMMAQQNQLFETFRTMQQNPTVNEPAKSADQPPELTPKNQWWKGFLVATATFVTIGSVGTILYTIHNVYATQTQTAQSLQKQTSEMEQRLMNFIEENKSVSENDTEQVKSPETFEEYLVEEMYLEAGEKFPKQQEEIIDYLLAQGDIENLNQFLKYHETTDDFLLLKIALLKDDTEEILSLYRKNDWDHLKQLTPIQKEKLALSLYQANYATEANLLLEK